MDLLAVEFRAPALCCDIDARVLELVRVPFLDVVALHAIAATDVENRRRFTLGRLVPQLGEPIVQRHVAQVGRSIVRLQTPEVRRRLILCRTEGRACTCALLVVEVYSTDIRLRCSVDKRPDARE